MTRGSLVVGVIAAFLCGVPVVWATAGWPAGRSGAVVLVVATLGLFAGMWVADALGAWWRMRGYHAVVIEEPGRVHVIDDLEGLESFWRAVRTWG